MRTYKLSKLIDKPEHRLKALMKKEWSKIIRLEKIIQDSKDFNIPLSPITTSSIKEKKEHYYRELNKISNVWNIKYNDEYKGSFHKREYKDSHSLNMIEILNMKINEENNII